MRIAAVDFARCVPRQITAERAIFAAVRETPARSAISSRDLFDCVRQIEMSPSLPDRDVPIVGVGRRAGAEPRPSAALARRPMRQPTKPFPLFDRARFSTLGS